MVKDKEQHLDLGGAVDWATEFRVSHNASDFGRFLGNHGQKSSGVSRLRCPPWGFDSISFLRAPLGNEVQQDQGDPLAPQGAQDLRVPLEQQERKVSQ